VRAAHLGADGRADLGDQVGIPAAGQADRLRENGRLTQPGEPVQGLGAGPEGGEAEAGHRRLLLVQ
jgi:hypothetical protein